MKNMKRISFLLPALMVLLLASCGGKKLTPEQMDAEITNINDSLKIKGQEWITVLGNSFMNKDFSALKPRREAIANYLDEKIAYVNDLKDVGGSEEYRKEEIAFLKYERNLVDQAFMPFEKLGADATMEQIQQQVSALTPITSMEVENINKVYAKQKEYAEKNKFLPAVSKVK